MSTLEGLELTVHSNVRERADNPVVFIAASFAVFYYLLSRRLVFLVDHALVCGLAAIEEVTNLIVLPLSAFHARGSYELHLLLGLLVHMVVAGLPIANSIKRFG